MVDYDFLDVLLLHTIDIAGLIFVNTAYVRRQNDSQWGLIQNLYYFWIINGMNSINVPLSHSIFINKRNCPIP